MSLNTRMNGVCNKMVRGILLIFVLGFLFQCGKSDDSVKNGGSADDGSAKDDDPALVTLELSTQEVTFNDVSGAVGDTYTISVSSPPSAEKTIEVKLTSTDSSLGVSPKRVMFTPTDASPQTITVKRANDAVAIITTDITGTIEHAITTGAEFTNFAMMENTVNVTVTPYIPDSDGDGLIEIWNRRMLDNIRLDLAGKSYKTSAGNMGNDAGCPAIGCNGYELMANIDIGSTAIWVPLGNSGSRFTGTFEGNGRTIANIRVNSTSNVNAGFFGATGGSAEIRNVGIISGGVSAAPSSGGLVGRSFSPLTITNSYFSGSGGVSASSSSGGLVGRSDDTLTITNSYFSGSGGVTSDASSSSSSGGLVGRSDASLTITNSYFSGSGGVTSKSGSSSASGGLVGNSRDTLMIMNSYFSGSGDVTSFSRSASASASASSGGLVGRSTDTLMITNSYSSGSGNVTSESATAASLAGGLVGRSDASLTITNSYSSGLSGVSSSSFSSSSSGGLVGSSSGNSAMLTFVNSYWNTDAPQLTDDGMTAQAPKRARGDAVADPMGAVRLTLAELKATSGTFPDLLGDAWVLGTDQQLPAVKQCILDMAGTGGCASPAMYGDLLDGQQR